MQDAYDAGYLPDDVDCDQDLVRFHIGAANEFHNGIHEQREQEITQLRERVKELEAAIEGLCVIHHVGCDLSDPRGTLENVIHVSNMWMLDPLVSSDAEKFALERKIEALEKYTDMCAAFRTKPSIESLRHHIEQLRKGGE